jgi:hypothetical protein
MNRFCRLALIVRGINILEDRLPRDAELLRSVLADAQHETPSFEVTFERLEY